MNECDRIRDEFSGYLDGAVTGTAMQEIALHLRGCSGCAEEFAAWRNAQSLVSAIGPAKAPEDLGLRLRVALSQQSAHTARANLDRWRIRWQNTARPLLLRASAGLASTILLVGSLSFLAEPLSATDQPLEVDSGPRFLYSSFTPPGAIGDRDHPVIVEAFISGNGRVYDYRIVSGSTDAKTRSELENALLFTVFSPARTFGEPVRGVIILSFSGVSVRG